MTDLLSRMQVVGVSSYQGLTRVLYCGLSWYLADATLNMGVEIDKLRAKKPLPTDVLPHDSSRWSEKGLSAKSARASTLLRQVHRTRQTLTLEKPTRCGHCLYLARYRDDQHMEH